MRIDPSLSIYHEDANARTEFSRAEIKRCRLLLRRLRYLEAQIRETGGLASDSANGGAAFTEWELEALEWILAEVGFLAEDRTAQAVSQ